MRYVVQPTPDFKPINAKASKGGSRVSKCALSRIRPRVGNLKIKSASSGAETS